MDVAVEGFSGAAGGLVGRCLAFPFETLKQRRTREPDCAVLDVLREGPEALYRGVHWSAIEAWNSKGFQFMAVTKLRNLYRASTGRKPTNLFVAIVIGYIADVLSLWNTITFENIIARLQTDPKGFSLRKEILSVAFARKVLSQLPVYLILALRPGIEHGLFDVFKHLWLKRRNQNITALSLPPVAAFLLGACARFVATLFVYPYIRVKTLAISQKGALKAGDDRGRVSYTQMLLRTLRDEGFFALYTGAGFELSRGVSQSAVMFLVMETLRARVRRLMQLLWSRWQSVA